MLFCICWVDAKCKSPCFQKCKMWSTLKIHDDFIRCPRNLDSDRQPPPTAPMILIRLQNKEQFLYFFLSPSSSSISSLIFLLHFEFDFYVSASLRLSIPKTIGRFVQAPGCHFQCPMRFSLRCTSNNHFQALDKEPECPRDAVRPLGACPPELAVSFSLQCIFFRTVW